LKHVYAKELLDFESGCLQLSQAAYGATDGVPIEHMLTLASGQLADRTAYPLEHIAKDYYNAMKWIHTLAQDKKYTHPSTEEGLAERMSAERYISAMQIAWKNTCFYSTKNGRIGIGRVEIQRGDSVCVFFTAYVPFILRFDKTRFFFRLIGEVYGQGLMDGEEFNAKNPKNHHDTFVIGWYYAL
jgi:hypothetical protein